MYGLSYFDRKIKPEKSPHVLDKWILSSLEELIIKIGNKLDNFDLTSSAILIENFISQLSTWYLRL